MELGKSKWVAVGVLGAALCGGCGGAKKTAKAVPIDNNSAEPDKLLFEKAEKDLKHGNDTVGRMEMQTLLNTYPDSEYQARAKLSIADSYFKAGGQTNLTQAIAEYQDFITFFPFLDEAAYAQSQVGMAHYRAMEKPDRDRSEALEAEGAFQTFLQKYPDSPLRPQMEQRLREVQEVLAEGDFSVASFYYLRGAYLASAARLVQLVTRYPLYSQADKVNWMLGSIYEKTEHNEYAGQMYGRIIKDYPLSPLAAEAKEKLMKFGMPVPQADPQAMARMKAEQNNPHGRGSLVTRPLGMLKNAPDVSMAAHFGTPTMTPEDDGTGATTLVSGGTSTLGGTPPPAATGTGAYVETVTPGANAAAGTKAGTPAAYAPAASSPAAAAGSETAPSTEANDSGQAFDPGASDPTPAAQGSTNASATSTASSTANTDGTTNSSTATTPKNSQAESSSKKKKKKLLVF